MINIDVLKEEVLKSENGDPEATKVVFEALRPMKGDTVDQIEEKLYWFLRINFIESFTYPDAPFHKKIDRYFSEQIASFLDTGSVKYKVALFEGFRESAKTTRIKFCLTYLAVYLPELVDYTPVISEDGSSSKQFIVDIYNLLVASRVRKYAGKLIDSSGKNEQKATHSMEKFTTTNGITIRARSARQSLRGSQQVEIDDDGSVNTKRPKVAIFDDIETEKTILSFSETEHIRKVMGATIDGLDARLGFAIILGNMLSVRGNIHFFESKADFLLKIPIIENGIPTWPGKYTLTDKEAVSSGKVSIEEIERKSLNFDAEYMLAPARSEVYFDDSIARSIDESLLIEENERDGNGYLEIEGPIFGSKYVIIADSAKGNGGDPSAFIVLKTTGALFEEVANFKNNKIRPESFASFIEEIAHKYNRAFCILEANYPGNETISFLSKTYKNIYVDAKNEYGFITTVKTKPEMFLALKTLLRSTLLRVRSRILYSMILEYPLSEIQKIDDRAGSRDSFGGHFDLLICAAIGALCAPQSVESQSDDVVSMLNARTEKIFSGPRQRL